MNTVVKLPVGPALAGARARFAEPFLRGPVPWAWLTAAGALPGKALHVAMAVRFRAGRANANTVPVSLSEVARAFRFNRAQASRGLDALERAKLVAVERRIGKKPVVTILEPEKPPEGTIAYAAGVVRPMGTEDD